MKICPDCNTKLEENIATCPKCGCPINQKSNTNIDTTIISIVSLVMSLIIIIANIKHATAYSLLFIIFPIFIITNMLKDKNIIKNKIPTYILDGITILYLGYLAVNVILNLRFAIGLFVEYISFSYLALLFQIITLTVNYIFIAIMVIGLFNTKELKFIKENIDIIYFINIGVIALNFISGLIQTIGYNMPGVIISLTLDTSFYILLSTYIKQLNQKEVL